MLRGIVTDNQDPMERGRVRVQVWGLHEEEDENLPWAEVMGCTAFPLHQGQGMAQVIPKGATVWVDFEHDDLNCPVVLGIFVGHQAETMDAANPGNSDFQGGAGAGGAYGQMATMNLPGGASFVFDAVNKTSSFNMGGVGFKADSENKEFNISNGRGAQIKMEGRDVRIPGTLYVGKVIEGSFF